MGPNEIGEVCKILDSQRIPINSDERAKRIIGKSKNELFPYYGATGLVGYIDDFLFDGEYLLLGEDGAPFLESYKDKAYLVKGKFWVNNHAHILDALFSKAYLCHWLNQIDYREFVTGTTRLKLNQASMKEIPIILAPLPEQYSIVAKIEELFSELDKGVEALKAAQQRLKVYRQAVLDSAVLETEAKPLEEVIVSLNQGWSPKCYNEPSGNNHEWGVIKTTAVQARYFQGEENKRLPEELPPRTQHELEKGDLLITRAGPRVRAGICCLVRHVRPHLMNCDKVYRIRLNSEIALPEYVEILLNSPTYSRIIERMKTGISDSGVNITQKGLLKIEVPIPSLAQQTRIVQEIESRLSVADKIEESIAKSLKQAEALRQSILKKAFSGKLVPQDPNDEPAEKLLARIRAERTSQLPKKGLRPVVRRAAKKGV